MKPDGWVEIGGSKHDKYERADRPDVLIIVPRHKQLSPGVARSIARLAGWIQEVAMAHYVGILDGSGDTWGVRVPDLPGCHGGGDTAEAAITDAISAAREWAEHHNAKGVALPVSLRCVRSSVMAKWMCGRAKRR